MLSTSYIIYIKWKNTQDNNSVSDSKYTSTDIHYCCNANYLPIPVNKIQLIRFFKIWPSKIGSSHYHLYKVVKLIQ